MFVTGIEPGALMRWCFLGLVPYERALLLQQSLVKQQRTPLLLLLEHPPTYTLGRRFQGETFGHLDHLRSFAHVQHTNRGGQITFHGPGQLIGYPIMNLKDIKVLILLLIMKAGCERLCLSVRINAHSLAKNKISLKCISL
jgi:lipoate-protein ligase B